MAREMAFPKEIADDRLRKLRAAVRCDARGLRAARDQRLRHDQVGQRQARVDDLREGAGVQHAVLPVQALQRRQRMPGIAVLAVVIVLDDPGLRILGPREQLEAARHAHRIAQRRLVRGRDDRQLRIGRAAPAVGDAQAVRVDRDRDHALAGALQHLARRRKARLFHPRAIVSRQQRARDQRQARAMPGGDEDLGRAAGYAA